MVDPIFDYQFRLILIGDSTVGKSSLLKYFTDGKFAELSDPTVGVDFFARIIEVQDGTRIKLQLWDTAGQERFRSITKSYYRNSVGALLVYDVCNRSSFEHIPLWMMEAKRSIEPHRPVFALVGCKVDLVGTDNKNGARREVSCEEARMFAEENGKYLLWPLSEVAMTQCPNTVRLDLNEIMRTGSPNRFNHILIYTSTNSSSICTSVRE